MKKMLLRLTTLALILVTALSFVGCSLFEADNSGKPNNGQTGNLPDSSLLASSVTFEGLAEEAKIKDMSVAAQRVYRSGVSILMENSDGSSRGSGVLVDITTKNEDGEVLETENEFYILTNQHVISDTGDITVYLTDKEGRNYGDIGYDESFIFEGVIDNNIHKDCAITLVGGDDESDVAVLKLDLSKGDGNVKPEDIEPATAASESYLPQLGEPVLALGNPGGYLPNTVSVGVISYIDRCVTLDIGDLVLIQHNASIDHGSSGGGLFNAYGELIGLTNAGSDSLNNIFYAVPHIHQTIEEDNGFITIAKQLIASKTSTNYGYISSRWKIGITITEEADQANNSYVLVKEVVSGSNAELSGVKINDIITSVSYYDADGEKVDAAINSLSDFSTAVAEIKKSYGIGDSFNIGVQRLEGRKYVNKDLTITLSTEYIFCDTGK